MPAEAMPSAKDQAALDDADADSFADQVPSAVNCCPLQKGIILGVFFDGTCNNKYADAAAGEETNVARLWEVYQVFEDDRYVRDKLYIIGVGQSDGNEPVEVPGTAPAGGAGQNFWGGVGGTGGKERLLIAYRWIKSKIKSMRPEEVKLIDTYGFSRGSSSARTFVNLVNQALKKDVQNVTHRFLGIFDTVGSWGSDEEPFVNEGLDSGDSLAWAHFTARHEHREHFPLTKLPGADKEYAGVHSDVGGGYADQLPRVRNGMAFVTCNHMYKRSIESNVDMKEPPKNCFDIEKLYAESEEYTGPALADPRGAWAAKAMAWKDTYIHDSTGYSPANWSAAGQIRVVLEHKKKKLGAMPPNFTWT